MDHEIQSREQSSEDQESPTASEIQILVVSPNGDVEVRKILNTLDAMLAIVGGTLCFFQSGIDETIGVCHGEGVLLGFPPCRYIEATGALIFGTFILAGDGLALRSLSVEQIFEGLRAFLPPLTIAQVCEALRREKETLQIIEGWSRERRD